MSSGPGDLFTRDGHLSMLSLDRYDVGELEAGACHRIEQHVDACACCRARLDDVRTPLVIPLPRVPLARDAGVATVAYLVATAAASVAAATMLWIGASGLGARTVVLHVSEPAPNASSYTSVAHEYSEPVAPDLASDVASDLVPELAIEATLDGIVASPSGEGWLGVAVLDGDPTAPVVVAVVLAPREVDEPTNVVLPRRFVRANAVAVLCAAPPELVLGASFEPDAGCVVRTLDVVPLSP